MLTDFQFYFYFFCRLYQKVDFIFIFILTPRLNFFEKNPVKQTIKKCWPNNTKGANRYSILKILIIYDNEVYTPTVYSVQRLTAR